MPDQNFISKLKQGDEDAFRRLVERCKDQVYNTCLGFLRNPQDAEDTAQEVFVNVYQSINTFNENAALATWIYRIAVNKSLELIRYRKREKRAAFFKASMNKDDGPDDFEDANTFVHPGICLEQKERAGILMDAIEDLPEQQKTAFVLHKIEGLSYKEIAQVMRKSVSAVESLIHRARKNLQLSLYDYYKSDT